MMKHYLLSLFTIFLLLLSNSFALRAATSGSCGANMNFAITSNSDGTKTMTITGSGEMAYYSAKTSYPWYGETFHHLSYRVTGNATIGNYAFAGNTKLKDVSIQINNIDINQYAFYQCSNLQTVTISEISSSRSNVINIGNSAFYDCTSLTQITTNNQLSYPYLYVNSIGNKTFGNCTKLTTLSLFVKSSIGEDVILGSGVKELTLNVGYDNCTLAMSAFANLSLNKLTINDLGQDDSSQKLTCANYSVTPPFKNTTIKQLESTLLYYPSGLLKYAKIDDAVLNMSYGAYIAKDAFSNCTIVSLTMYGSTLSDNAFHANSFDYSTVGSILTNCSSLGQVYKNANLTYLPNAMPNKILQIQVLNNPYQSQIDQLLAVPHCTYNVSDYFKNQAARTNTFDCSGQYNVEAVAASGYEFVRWSDGVTTADHAISFLSGTSEVKPLIGDQKHRIMLQIVDNDFNCKVYSKDNLLLTPKNGIYYLYSGIDDVITIRLGNSSSLFTGWDIPAELKKYATEDPTTHALTINLSRVADGQYVRYAITAMRLQRYELTLVTKYGDEATVSSVYSFAEGESVEDYFSDFCYSHWYKNKSWEFDHYEEDGKFLSSDCHYSYTMPAHNVTLTAVMREKIEVDYTVYYNITFHDIDGSVIKTEKVAEGRPLTSVDVKISKLNDECQYFNSWAASPNAKEAVHAATEDMSVYPFISTYTYVVLYFSGEDDFEPKIEEVNCGDSPRGRISDDDTNHYSYVWRDTNEGSTTIWVIREEVFDQEGNIIETKMKNVFEVGSIEGLPTGEIEAYALKLAGTAWHVFFIDEDDKVLDYQLVDDGKDAVLPDWTDAEDWDQPVTNITDNMIIYYNNSTDIKDIQSEAGKQSNAQKVLIDGAIYILRDGKAYNLLGAEVK